METTFLTLGLFLILCGFLLLIADLFVGSGVLFAVALAAVAVGVVFVFKYDTTIGVYSLGGVAVALPTTIYLLLRLGPMRRLFHTPEVEATVANLPANQELLDLKGRYGKTISALRPAGVVDFDGRRVDSLTEGMMVEPGQWVRCVDVRAGRVVVRPAKKPDITDLEAPLFP